MHDTRSSCQTDIEEAAVIIKNAMNHPSFVKHMAVISQKISQSFRKHKQSWIMNRVQRNKTDEPNNLREEQKKKKKISSAINL